MSDKDETLYDQIQFFAIFIYAQETKMSTSSTIDTFQRLGQRSFSLIHYRFIQSNMSSHSPILDCDGAGSIWFCQRDKS